MVAEVQFTFLSPANSAMSACLLLPRMLSDFLKACKYMSTAVSGVCKWVARFQVYNTIQMCNDPDPNFLLYMLLPVASNDARISSLHSVDLIGMHA